MIKQVLTTIKLAFLVLVLFSCRNGKENPPMLTLTDTELTVLANDVLNVTAFYQKGDRKIKEFKVVGLGEDVIKTDNDYINYFRYNVRVPADAGGTDVKVVFTVTDTRGNESSEELLLHIETPFWTKVSNGIMSNSQGPSSNAWDFISGNRKTSLDDKFEKDIVDNTSGADGNFSNGGWRGLNLTKFVLVPEYSYENASQETAKEAYDLGEELTRINGVDLIEGAIVIAKIRETESLAVIKITEVYDDGVNGGTGNNSDYRKFIYKK